MRPPKCSNPGEWPKIINYPDVVNRWTTRAHEVTKQMKMERETNQQQCLPAVDARHPRNRHDSQRAEQPMKEKVMIHRIPLAGSATQRIIRDIQCQAEPIETRRKSRKADPQ